jgi:hypothetical protein
MEYAVLYLVSKFGLVEPDVDLRYHRLATRLVRISHQINDSALLETSQSQVATAPCPFVPSAAPGFDCGLIWKSSSVGRSTLVRPSLVSRFGLDPSIVDVPMLRRLYRPGKPIHWDVVEKETIDEIIFRTTKLRNRLILELIA